MRCSLLLAYPPKYLKLLALFPVLISTPFDARENLIKEEFEGRNFRENSFTPKPQQSGDRTLLCEAMTVEGFVLILNVRQERKFVH